MDENKEKIENQTPEAVPLPDKTVKKIETKKENKQNPDKLDEEVKQVSEFEKKEFVDLDNIAKLIDKAKEDTAELIKKNNDITQDQDKNIVTSGLTLSEEDALKAQIFGCWSIPLGLPYNEDLLVRIKLMLEPDGSVAKTEILDHARMNKPGQGFYKVLAESALRAVKLCQPLRVPTTGYERWKELQLNFDAREMLEG
ncbi:cell envelope biogenesis protein TolA [Candidatus Pelagibacter sp.]|nr:cell envelope biogenesis protein TolA [Candidatus Pelagibacter sp.]